MAKKTPHGKPRTEYVYGTTTGLVDHMAVTFNSLTGEITFGSEMTNTYSEIAYSRGSKDPKVVTRIPQPASALCFDQDP